MQRLRLEVVRRGHVLGAGDVERLHHMGAGREPRDGLAGRIGEAERELHFGESGFVASMMALPATLPSAFTASGMAAHGTASTMTSAFRRILHGEDFETVATKPSTFFPVCLLSA